MKTSWVAKGTTPVFQFPAVLQSPSPARPVQWTALGCVEPGVSTVKYITAEDCVKTPYPSTVTVTFSVAAVPLNVVIDKPELKLAPGITRSPPFPPSPVFDV